MAGSIEKFKDALGFSESTGSYSTIASTGKAFGKYQFTEGRLKDIIRIFKLTPFTVSEFLADPVLQDQIFNKHVELMGDELEELNLKRFVGQSITGRNKWPYKTNIGAFGLLGGAHLGGSGGVKALLVNGQDRKDAYGTYVSDYIAKFSMLVDGNKGTKVFNNEMIAGVSLPIILALAGGAYFMFFK